MVYWFGVCYWIQFVLAVHGGMGDAGGLGAVPAVLPRSRRCTWACSRWLAGILMRRWWAVPAVAALWVAVEVTHGYSGLRLAGAGQCRHRYGHAACAWRRITGVYGLSFVFAMMTAAALALAVLRRPRLELAVAAAAAAAGLPAAPAGRRSAAARRRVLVQPNISETQQWTPDIARRDASGTWRRFRCGRSLSGGPQPPSIMVWPEVPAPFYYDEDPRFRDYVDELAHTTHAYLLLGVVAHTPQRRAAQFRASGFARGRPVSRYDKVNLVPFGEFVPWPFDYAGQAHLHRSRRFRRRQRVVVSPVDDHRIGAFICYESVFPNFVRQFAAGGAEVLFNISNDGWFGQSAARRQHLEIVRMRAAENRRWILRSTNDGITATIDPGRAACAAPCRFISKALPTPASTT